MQLGCKSIKDNSSTNNARMLLEPLLEIHHLKLMYLKVVKNMQSSLIPFKKLTFF